MVPEFNRKEYNRMCAEFLDFKHEGSSEYYTTTLWGGASFTLFQMKFDSDWNWIMMVIQKIVSIRLELKDYHVVEWFEVYFYSTGCMVKSGLQHADGETVSPYYYQSSVWKPSSKEAVVESIWQFLNWYKQIEK